MMMMTVMMSTHCMQCNYVLVIDALGLFY